ncbi:MAG: hypothetical protein V5A76_02030 [Candidatus Thermoplasmatota archaeon]
MDNGSICFIGDVRFSIDGPTEFKNILIKEFNKKDIYEKDFDVSWKIDYKPNLLAEDIDGRLKKEERGAFFDTGYSADIDWKRETVTIHYDKRILDDTLINRIAKFWDWSYMSPTEIFIKNTVYDILEPISHVVMSGKGSGFIHASAVSGGSEKEGSALFTGEGGVGKTALAIQGIKNDLNYMNDDLSLVDNDVFCYHYPKNLQIYGYNIDVDPSLKKRFFQNKSLLNKIMWRLRYTLKGGSSVRRRVDPRRLFGNSITKRSRISEVFFLRRGDTLEIEPMDKTRFVDKELEIIKEEFSDFISSLKKDNRKMYDSFVEGTKKLYKNIYENSNCRTVYIPDDMDFEKVFTHIENEGLF